MGSYEGNNLRRNNLHHKSICLVTHKDHAQCIHRLFVRVILVMIRNGEEVCVSKGVGVGVCGAFRAFASLGKYFINSRHSASALAAKSAKTETTAAIILNKLDRISDTSENKG